MTPEVAVIARVSAVPERRHELVTALREHALTHVDREPGTRCFIVHEASDDPATLWVYEQYDTRADLESHMAAEWFARLGPILTPLIDRPIELTFLTPLHGKGL